MNWRWQRRDGEPAADAAAAATAGVLSPDALIAQADILRDEKRWAEAAEQYQKALAAAPERAAIWVQLGNCRKEAGDRAGAEAAYRRSLELTPDNADTHLQLGHVQKLQGDRMAAIASYARALRADRFCTPALNELIALGEGWRAEQESGIGRHLLGEMLRTVEELRNSLARLERMLPNVAGLSSFPLAQYNLLAAQHRLAEPPGPVPPQRWAVVVFGAGGPGDTTAALRGVAAAGDCIVGVCVITSAAEEAALRQMAWGGVACPVTVCHPGETPAVPPCDWVLAIDGRAVLLPGALAWLNWTVSRAAPAAVYADEDHAAAGADGAVSPDRPVLKAVRDPEANLPPFRHGMLAMRADLALPLLADALSDADPLQRIAESLERTGAVAHLPRILCRRQAALPPPRQRAAARLMPADDNGRIAVVIPTRNGAATLRPCLAALRATASDADRLEIILLDNGSDQPETLALLEQAPAKVLRDDAPFNWARLSNTGAAVATADIVLFLNDDVVLSTAGWDRVLRRQLVRPEIGAVGARLLYPDGGVQHAGMVFGPDGRAEHEGVAVTGVPPETAARWTTRRRVGGVTGAFLACRRADFAALGGFDASHLPIWFNDVDFCLRLRRAGLCILYAPEIVATHHESRTLAGQPEDARRRAIWTESLAEMKRRWGRALETDPGFNPMFARTGRPFELLAEPSPLAIEQHLLLSVQDNPWALP